MRDKLSFPIEYINIYYYHRDKKHSRHVQNLTTSINNFSALVFFFISASFTFSSFVFRFQQNADRKPCDISIQQTLLDGRSGEVEKIGMLRKREWETRALTDIDRDHKRYTVPSLPRGRDPCLCWPAVGVALSQALLSASSMKSAIARNCLELAQSNHPPFPVRIRAYINR